MKFGVCNPYTNIKLIKSEGFDYIELALSVVNAMSDREFKAVYKEVEKHSFPAESYNGFFPGDIRLTGEGVDLNSIREYAKRGFARASELGGKVAVLGSGTARKIPEGFDRKTAEAQFVDVLRVCGDEAGRVGMEIVIEPLQAKETDLINTVAEGLEFVERANHEKVRCLVDFFHTFRSRETLDAVINSNGMLRHVHLARANDDRKIPTSEDIDSCRPWAEALKKCGYDLRISLEGAFLPDVKTAIKNVKPVLELFR